MPVDLSGLAVAVAAAFGLLLGSFLNVCIYRIPRDLSVVAPRSFCPECGSSIAWYDNIPILSYILLRGRCRQCSQRIGVRYVFVEAVTSVLFAWVVFRYGLRPISFKWMIFEALLIVLFWTDLEERILPDELTLGGSLLGFIYAWFVLVPGAAGPLVLPGGSFHWHSLVNSAAGAFVLAVPIWILGALYSKVRKREGLGQGDIKLLVMVGAFLGPAGGLAALLIGALGGSIIGAGYILLAGKTSSYQLPFGTFLCAGAALIPLLGESGRLPLGVF